MKFMPMVGVVLTGRGNRNMITLYEQLNLRGVRIRESSLTVAVREC